LLGGRGAAVALQREGVLFLARDGEFLGQHFRRLAHGQPADRVGQTEPHGGHRPEMMRAEVQQRPQLRPPALAAGQLLEKVGRLGAVQQRNPAHRLDSAGDNGPRLA
jgi:hypothetical protein